MRRFAFVVLALVASVSALADTLLDTRPFPYTGSNAPYSVPAGTDYIVVKMWGAGGGDGVISRGGGGAFVTASITASAGQSFTVMVGGKGYGHAVGGWPGGGNAASTTIATTGGAGGGGYTRVYSYGPNVNLMAGAGGGGGNGNGVSAGGAGGDQMGGNGVGPGSTFGYGGQPTFGGAGGTGSWGASSNGAAGNGYQGGSNYYNGGYVGGGGGGGYYGGGAGSSYVTASGGGGGGTSYISGADSSNVVGGTGNIPGGISDPDYPGGSIGYGGLDNDTYNDGFDGYVVIKAYAKSSLPVFPSSLPDQFVNQMQPSNTITAYTVPFQSPPKPALSSFTASNLPYGLSASNPGGVITGTPSVGNATSVSVTYTAVNSQGSVQAHQNWTVTPAVLIPNCSITGQTVPQSTIRIQASGHANFGIMRIEGTMWPPATVNGGNPIKFTDSYTDASENDWSQTWYYTIPAVGHYEVTVRVVDIYSNGADWPATQNWPIDVANSYQAAPYSTGFDTYTHGNLQGQDGWVVWHGAANVTAPGDSSFPGPNPQAGGAALTLAANNPITQVYKYFSSTDATEFVDLYIRPFATSTFTDSTMIDYADSQISFLKTGATQATIYILNGNGGGGGTFVATTATTTTDSSGLGSSWTRITLGLNYISHTVSVYKDGTLITSGVGMKGSGASNFTELTFFGSSTGASYLDSLNVQATIPFTISAPSSVTKTASSFQSLTVGCAAAVSNGSPVVAYAVSIDGGQTTKATSSTTSIVVAGLSEATFYNVTVRALNAAQVWSTWTSPISMETLVDNQVPSVPGKPTLTPLSDTSISLTWPASTDNYAMAGYIVYRNGTALNTKSNLFATNTFTDTGLAEYTQYTYTVAAVDASKAQNQSAQGASNAAKTLLNPLHDYNNNGIKNGVEQALGLDPTATNPVDSNNQNVQLDVQNPR